MLFVECHDYIVTLFIVFFNKKAMKIYNCMNSDGKKITPHESRV